MRADAGPDRAPMMARIAWCAAVPLMAIGLYVPLGVSAVLLAGEPILGTALAGLAVFASVGVARAVRPQWFAYAPPPASRRRGASLWALVLVCLVMAFLAGQLVAVWAYSQLGSSGFDGSVRARAAAGTAVSGLLGLVAAPMGEEGLFRGLVYPLLRRKVAVAAAMTVSATAFALMHGNVVQIAVTLPLAAVLALVYELTRRMWPCVVLHLGFNLTASLIPAAGLAPFARPPFLVVAVVSFCVLTSFLVARIMPRDEDAATRAP